MEPIKIEVTVGVNVDLSQGTKDFVLDLVSKKLNAQKDAVAASMDPLKSVIDMLQQVAKGQAAPEQHFPVVPNDASIATEAQTESDALNEAAKAAEAKKAAEQEKAAEQPAPSKENKGSEKSIGIEDVRRALTEKVNDHRAAIKAKLTELGAPSVTKLDSSKYEEMYNYLISL